MTNTIGSLLALAVTTSIALANGGGEDPKNAFQEKSGWKPGSGINLADSDEFKLNLSNLIQVGYNYAQYGGKSVGNDDATIPKGSQSSFDVAHVRTTLSGHAFGKNLLYKLQIESAGANANVDNANADNTSILRDAWAQWNFLADANTVGLRMGQSKSGFGLESTGALGGLYFVERSSASETFSGLRSRGAWLYGSHMENKMRWNAGLQNGDVAGRALGRVEEAGGNADNTNSQLNVVGNVSFDPLGDTTGGKTNQYVMQGDLDGAKALLGTIGAGIMIGNEVALVGNGVGDDVTTYNLNTAWMFGSGFTAQAEFFSRADNLANNTATRDTEGYYGMLTYTLAKAGNSDMQWGVGVRYSSVELVDVANTTTDLSANEFSIVANAFYHGHACKTQIELTTVDTDNSSSATSSTDNDYLVRVQFQLMF
ncbi:hypothetical protein LBMAG49_30450 [Planctomycetota bacterium]|nr:hypothetical protein LBMAG49_30450 [Planctomycetota bacterium]